MPLWREAHFEVKMLKHIILRALLEVEMSKKCTLLWHKATLEVNMQKKTKNSTCSDAFRRSDVGFVLELQSDGRRGTFSEGRQRCMSRGRRDGKRRMSQTCSAVLALIS